MGKVFDSIGPALEAWILAQPMFFVATAPPTGHVNCSPKGLPGTLAILGPERVAYLDLTGSGIETIAHLQADSRIVLMLCSFDARPRIVRLHGSGRVHRLGEPEFAALESHFAAYAGARAIIDVDVDRVSDSCGFGVPVMSFAGERRLLTDDHERRGSDGLQEYRSVTNRRSLDGLPGY